MSRSWWTRGVLAVAIVLAAGSARAGGTRVRFEIDQPFRFGGRGYDGGTIWVRSLSAYTPSITMLEVWIQGECLGMMPAAVLEGTEPDGAAEAVFMRGSDGRLELTGFQLRSTRASGR
jgi:hypothetical protein